MDGLEIESRWWKREFSLIPKNQTHFVTHPAYYSIGNWDFFGGKAAGA
jgi:hypothetical protein